METLERKAGQGKLQVGQSLQILDAGVAVPTRVPREISRHGLTRLKMLSEGAFGEVHQHQLEEKGHSHLASARREGVRPIYRGARAAVVLDRSCSRVQVQPHSDV